MHKLRKDLKSGKWLAPFILIVIGLSVISFAKSTHAEINKPTDEWGVFDLMLLVGDIDETGTEVHRYVGEDGLPVVDSWDWSLHTVRCGPPASAETLSLKTWSVFLDDGTILRLDDIATIEEGFMQPLPEGALCGPIHFVSSSPPAEVLELAANGRPVRLEFFTSVEGYLPSRVETEFVRVGTEGEHNSFIALPIPSQGSLTTD